MQIMNMHTHVSMLWQLQLLKRLCDYRMGELFIDMGQLYLA